MLNHQNTSDESHQENEVKTTEENVQYHFSVNNSTKKKERVSSACSNCRRSNLLLLLN